MVSVPFVSGAQALGFILLLDMVDVILFFKCYQYSRKECIWSVNIISQWGVDMAGSSLIRNANYQNICVINEAAETQATPH